MNTVKVSDVMRREIVSVSVEASLQAAAKVMFEKNVGSLGVKKDGVMVGVVTKLDFVKAISSGKKIKTIGEIMSTPLVKVSSDADLIETIGIMHKNNIKHLFVEEKKSIIGIKMSGVVGIVSLTDITNYLQDVIS